MSQYSYVPGDSRLVDHIIGELKSKGIFDQFRKECIADVDTKPAYQNLRLRVEGSVSGFLSRQKWRPDLNKNQLREKLRKHIHEANYLEQGVERIVDQVVNPKVASVFIPQVEDLVYSFLGIQKPKSSSTTTNARPDLIQDEKGVLPSYLDNFSLDSAKSQVEKMMVIEEKQDVIKMEVDQESVLDKYEARVAVDPTVIKSKEIMQPDLAQESNSSSKYDKKEDIKDEFIITTELSNLSMDIPLPVDPPKIEVQEESTEFKQSDTETSLDSAIMRNVSPLTPVRSFNNENSCDAQPSFEERSIHNSEVEKKTENPIPISTFRFTIEKDVEVDIKPNKLISIKTSTSYEYNQGRINNYGAPIYDDSSSSNNLHIDYQSDKDGATVDSKTDQDTKTETVAVFSHDEQSKSKDNCEEKKRSHKSSHRSRDSYRHSSSKNSKDHRSNSKHSDKKDSNRSDRKSCKDDTTNSKSRHRDRSTDRSDRDKKESSDKKDKEKSDSAKDRHSSSRKSSSSSTKESKSSKHNSSSSSHRHSSSSMKYNDEKKSASNQNHEKKTSSNKSDDKKDEKDYRSSSKSSRDHSRQGSSHRSDKDKYKSSSSKEKDKENKKEVKKDKKVADDHYSASGRGNRTRRSTDRDSNDGNSSSSKGSTFMGTVITSNSTTDNKKSISKSENQSSSSDTTTGQSDFVEKVTSGGEKETLMKENVDTNKPLKPVIQLDSKLKTPVTESPQMTSVENKQVKKPMIAANMNEAIKLIKVRKQLAAEQEKKRQEAALLLEFQEKIHSSISQVYSGISGPELEFACMQKYTIEEKREELIHKDIEFTNDMETGGVTATVGDKSKKDHEVETDYVNTTAEVTSDSKQKKDPEVETDIVNRTPEVLSDKKLKKGSEVETGIVDIPPEVSTGGKPMNDPETYKTTTTKNEEEYIDDDYLNFVYGDPNKDPELRFFGEQETNLSMLEKDQFGEFYKSLEKFENKKIFLLNCDFYHEHIFKQLYEEMGHKYDIVNMIEVKAPVGGPSKLNTQDLAKNELILPVSTSHDCISVDDYSESCVFSPTLSSDCSLDTNEDYEQKIYEIIKKKSRQEVMEIILGGAGIENPLNVDAPITNTETSDVLDDTRRMNLKRKLNGVVDDIGPNNNNHKVLMPNKMRRLSLSEQITSTTEVADSTNSSPNTFKSKFIEKIRRVGLPRLKNSTIVSSPSSDKSVENYVQNSQNEKSPKLNGNIVSTKNVAENRPRKNKMAQRYETSDLYKPKLQYVSKRHSHVT